MSKRSNSSSIKGKKRLDCLSREVPKRKRTLLENSSSDTGSSSEEIPKRKRTLLEDSSSNTASSSEEIPKRKRTLLKDSSCDTTSSSNDTASSSEEIPKRKRAPLEDSSCDTTSSSSNTTSSSEEKPKRYFKVIDGQNATKEYVQDLFDRVSDESTSEEEVIRPRAAKGSSMFKHVDIEGNVKDTYTGATPKQAASKAFTKELRRLECKDSTMNILLLHPETNNVYSYTTQRTLLDKPAVIEVAGKEITFTYRNVVKEGIIKRKV